MNTLSASNPAFDKVKSRLAAFNNSVNADIEMAASLLNDGDRVAYFTPAAVVFAQSEPAASEMVFNIPTDADFFGTRINFYPEARIVSQTSPVFETEATYRPVDWTCTPDMAANQSGGYLTVLSYGAVNCLFEIRNEDGPYQNLPVSIASAFSSRYGLPMNLNVRAGPQVSAYLGGIDFPIDEFVRKGSAITVKITPTFVPRAAAPINPAVLEKLEYRIRGVFIGYKRVKSFKSESYPLTLTR